MKENDSEFCRCLRCNRKLKTEEARKRGYGEHCWKEHKIDIQNNKSHLFVIKR